MKLGNVIFNIKPMSIVLPESCNRFRHESNQLCLNRQLINALTFSSLLCKGRRLIVLALFTCFLRQN